jgi:hypothetical protein
MDSSPGVRRTVVKTVTSPAYDRGSPTKRIIDHKNAKVKHTKNANRVRGSADQMLYTIDPQNAYLVDRDFPLDSPSDEVIRKAIEKRGYNDDDFDDYNLENRRDFIRRMEERTRKFDEDFKNSNGYSVDNSNFHPAERSTNLHHILRESMK